MRCANYLLHRVFYVPPNYSSFLILQLEAGLQDEMQLMFHFTSFCNNLSPRFFTAGLPVFVSTSSSLMTS